MTHRLLAVLLLAASPAAARDLHVDALRGSDSTGDGSLAAPWRFYANATPIFLHGTADQTPLAARGSLANNVFSAGSGIAIELDGPKAGLARLSTSDFWEQPAGLLRDDTRGTLTSIAQVKAFRSATPDSFAADPLFLDPAAGNLRLPRSSPCVDAGEDVGAPAADHDGRDRPQDGDEDGTPRSDVGAFEVGARVHLRRGEMTALDPPFPARDAFFPMSSSNALTPSVKADFISGDRDTLPGTGALALYRVDPPPLERLFAVRDPSGPRFELAPCLRTP